MAADVGQSVEAQVFAVTTTGTTLAYTGNVAAGSTLLLFACAYAGADDFGAVTDPINGAWTKLGTTAITTSGSNDGIMAIYKFENSAALSTAGNRTVTIKTTVTIDCTLCLVEVTGVPTSSIMDPATYTTTGTNYANSASSVANSLTTTLATNDLYLTACCNGAGVDSTWTAGTTPWANVVSDGILSTLAFHLVKRANNADAPGTYSFTHTWAVGSADLVARMVALQSGGAAVSTFPLLPPPTIVRFVR